MQLFDRSRRWFLRSLAVVAIGIAGSVTLPSLALADKGPESFKGKPAPDISLKTLAGDEVKLSELKGKVVLVDLWATWCGPCVRSLPHIEELSKKENFKKEGLVVWAVNLREPPDKVTKFLKDKNMTVTVPLDSKGEAAAAYEVTGIPTTLVIGRDGNVAEVFVGAGPNTAKQLDAAIEKALKEKAPK